jgi:hypothetical protein
VIDLGPLGGAVGRELIEAEQTPPDGDDTDRDEIVDGESYTRVPTLPPLAAVLLGFAHGRAGQRRLQGKRRA